MRHTFLLEPGHWSVSGNYFDREGKKLAVDGTTEISHGPTSWASEGELHVGDDGEQVLANHYEIAPMPDGVDHTTWVCSDPVEGPIRGAITVVDDCVISSFRAESTDYHGVDVLRKAKGDYRSRGFAMRGAAKLSSWVLTITKSNDKKTQ